MGETTLASPRRLRRRVVLACCAAALLASIALAPAQAPATQSQDGGRLSSTSANATIAQRCAHAGALRGCIGAPHLLVRGHTVSWRALSGVHSYVVAIFFDGRRSRTRYVVVRRTWMRFRLRRGHHVTVNVRANVPGSPWGSEASIFFGRRKLTPVPAPAPVVSPPAPSAGVLPGLVMNDVPPHMYDFARAAAAGARIVRLEDVNDITQYMPWAARYGVKVDVLSHSFDISPIVNAYRHLPASERPYLAAIELLNEVWPDGIGPQLTGAQYAAGFDSSAHQQQAAQLPVPLLMQVRLATDAGTSWMNSLCSGPGSPGSSALANDLAPKPWLPQGNGLASHPYGGNMTRNQVDPNSLRNYTDTSGDVMGSQRWMKEELAVQACTGINAPVYITEYGAGTFTGPNGFGSEAAKVQIIGSMMAFAKSIELGGVDAPAGLAGGPKLAAVMLFAQYSWDSNLNSFGIMNGHSGALEQPAYNTFLAGARSL